MFGRRKKQDVIPEVEAFDQLTKAVVTGADQLAGMIGEKAAAEFVDSAAEIIARRGAPIGDASIPLPVGTKVIGFAGMRGTIVGIEGDRYIVQSDEFVGPPTYEPKDDVRPVEG